MNTRAFLNADPVLARKALFFEHFWEGQGPFPILFAKPHLAKGKNWIRHSIAEQHFDPIAALEEALALARFSLLDIDDGIPVARADLGTTLFPSFLGLKVHIEADVHPWLAEHLSLSEYAGMQNIGEFLTPEKAGGEMRTATEFYHLFRERAEEGSVPLPYIPDNQGIFDISHIVIGTDLFYGPTDDPDSVHAAQRNSLALYLEGTRLFKDLAGEETGSMLHGHGMPSGVWFPDIGARISEDSCTLISGDAIREFCVPYLEEAAQSFGGLFLHFCGHHMDFLRLSCGSSWARVLNLGNPESFDLNEVFSLCGKSGTVYFGHIDLADEEDDDDYLERMAETAGRNKAGLILVAPPVRYTGNAVSDVEIELTEDGTPDISIDRCRRLRERWHDLTAKFRFKRCV